MQQIQRDLSGNDCEQPKFSQQAFAGYSVRQRLLSASVSLAMTSSATVTYALANTAMPILTPVSSATVPHAINHTSANHIWQTGVHTGPSLSTHTALPFHASSTLHATTTATTPAHSTAWTHSWHASKNLVQAIASQTPGAHDLDLNSGNAMFPASGLAGFHTITLDIGGKHELISFDTKLSGAELVAAQQVLSGSKQEITINSRGIATGGLFDLNSATVSSLAAAVGGNIGSLYVSHGVKAVDTLSNLTLNGSLINLGSIVVGADSASKGQALDSIAAANIFNGLGAVISSAPGSGGIAPTSISLTTPGIFYNSGTVTSSGGLNVSASAINNIYAGAAAPTAQNAPLLSAAQNVNLSTASLTNSGIIASTSGNVNILNTSTSGDLNVANSGGIVQASHGNLNFNNSGYAGTGNINVMGGDWLSKQVNFNAGTGGIEANVDEITGLVNGTARSSHITASTENLNLGDICVSGDPTYYNTSGDITISGALTGNPDLALVASGNIIAKGGSLDTSSVTTKTVDGGAITLIAGANFVSDGKGGGSNPSGPPDTKSTLTLSDSANPGHGSLTGGYIDLSGNTVPGNKNAPLTLIDSSSVAGKGGDILMVAYSGTELNSGAIVATSGSATGATTLNAAGLTSSGNVTLIGSGPAILVQNVNAGALKIVADTPTIAGSATILNGTLTGSIVGSGSPTPTEVDVTQANASSVNIKTVGNFFGGVLLTAGAGGAANTAGANGGNVTISALGISVIAIDSSGGGGGGGNPGMAGGAGGKGGVVSLTALDNNIQIVSSTTGPGYINVSGGGGGGGGGAGDAGGDVAGKGGSGGAAGQVSINTPFAFTSTGIVYAYDGGAGGDGRPDVQSASGSGGGGGGGGGSIGGGGGGGAAGTVAANPLGMAAGGGGGGGLGPGGGGGGVKGSGTATAGTGGSSLGLTLGTAGTGGTSTTVGAGGQAGSTAPSLGGNGGTPSGGPLSGAGGSFATGGGGGQNTAAPPLQNDGSAATTVGGSGLVTLNVGDPTGTAKVPIEIDTATLSVTSTFKTGSVFLTTLSGALDIAGATMAAGTTLSIIGQAKSGPFTVSQPVNGTTIILNSAGSITTTGTGTINGTSATLTAKGNIIVATAVDSLSVVSGGSTATITEAASAGKALTLLASSVLAGGVFTLKSAEQINVTKGITAVNGTIDLEESGTLSAVGINITPALNAGNGSIILKTSGGTASVAAAGLLTAANLTITADGTVGLSTKPLSTNISNTITVTGNSANGIYLKDANRTTLNVTGSSTALGQTFSLVSAAQTLNIAKLTFSNVTVNDTFSTVGKGAVVALPGVSPGSQIGDGTGTVTITAAAASINQASILNPSIDAIKAVLTSSGGDVGSTLLSITAANLTASAAKGSVNIQDLSNTTLNAGSALNKYSVSAADLTVAGTLNGGQIALTASGQLTLNANVGSTKSTSVGLDGAIGISQNTKALTSGVTVSLNTSTGDVGSKGQYILTKATSSLTANGSGGANNFYINQTGNVALGASSSAGKSSLNLVDSGTLTVNASSTFDTLNITAPVITVNIGDTLKAVTAATFNSNAALAISGAGTINPGLSLSLGTIVGTKGTTSIALGAAKTGVGNPLAVALNGGSSGTNTITIATKGNFTADLGATNQIATDQTGAAGKVSITAANIVNLNSANKQVPIVIAANALSTSGSAGGTVTLTLTGTQAVTLDGTKATGTNPAPYQLQASGGTTGTAGSIAVTTSGNLTVNAGGIVLAGTGKAGSLSLASNKNLSVTAAGILDATAGLANVSISSGGTVPFTVDAGVAPVNGTIGKIVATNSSTFSNPFGALTLRTTSGNDDSITPGKALKLTAKSGITLGDAKSGGATNPLKSIGNSILDNLTINTGGNFSYNFDFAGKNLLALKGNPSGGTLNVTAGNIVNLSQATALAPILLSAPSLIGNAGTINFTTTGTQAVTLGSVTVLKGTPNFELSAVGMTNAGTITVKTAGALTVATGGVVLTGGNNNLTLNGAKGLTVTDNAVLNAGLATLSLTSGATAPFVIGAIGIFTNGTAGTLSAGSVSVTDVKGITVTSSITATTGNVTLDTAAFLNKGTVTGSGTSQLLFSDPGKNSLGIVSGGGGTYTGFNYVGFSTLGSVNVGDLITASTMLDATLHDINIAVGGALTFGSLTPGASVISGGGVTISAASFTSTATPAITINAVGSSVVVITDQAALTVGTVKGNIALGLSTSSKLGLVSNAGTLTIGGNPLSVANATLVGSSIVLNKSVTASGMLTALATGKTGVITTATGAALNGGSSPLVLGQGNTTLSKTAISVNAATVSLGAAAATGALNINNVAAGTVSGAVPIAALTYTSGAVTTVGSISTTKGGITVTDTGSQLSTAPSSSIQTIGGGISLIVGSGGSSLNIGMSSSLSTSSGSILLQDNNVASGQITVGIGVNMHASGTAKGVGQVSLVIGAVPTTVATGLVPGPTPSPAPTVNANNGGGVFYGVNGISTFNTNTLNSFGRNVVFSTASLANTHISLAGGDTITADPPEGAINSVALSTVANPLVITAPLAPLAPMPSFPAAPISSAPIVSPNVSLGQVLSGVSATAGLNSLPGINSLGQSSNVGGLNNIAAISSLNSLSDLPAQSAGASLQLQSGSKRLSAEVSNIVTRSLDRGPMLLSPQIQTVVQTDFGSVSVAAKSVALIIAFEGGVAVYNLHDSRKNAVVVSCGNHTVALAPGQSTVMTNRHVRFFEEINPAQRVAYRRMLSNDFADGLKSFRSEFNIISMLQGYEPLRQFVRSEEPEKRKVSQAMLKTAAILMGLSGAEPFEYMVAQPVTALNTARGN